jgi:hypothetical protein
LLKKSLKRIVAEEVADEDQLPKNPEVDQLACRDATPKIAMETVQRRHSNQKTCKDDSKYIGG